MKCEKCGGNLSLEDLKCPYCGEINKHAQQHIRDMERFQGEFQDTKENVYATAKRFTAVSVRMIVIAALVVLAVALAILGSRSYSLRRWILEKRAERNVAEYSAVMDRYLEEENFMEFSFFTEANRIDGYDTPYETYIPVIRASHQYRYLYSEIMGTYTNWIQDADQETMERCVSYLSDQLNFFYESLDMEKYNYISGVDSEQNKQALAQMEEHVKALLQTYCNLTQEETEALRQLSEAKRTVLLEERIGYEK